MCSLLELLSIEQSLLSVNLTVLVGRDMTLSCLFDKLSKPVEWSTLTIEWNMLNKDAEKNIVYTFEDGRAHVNRGVHMCFVDLEKAFDRVPRSALWGGALGVRGPGPFPKGCLVPVRPDACWTPVGLPFVTGSVHYFYGQNF
uniref:Uncharacterized protein n=1 Tax=Monopterus albus TaxID=43700 RepID=A0A3Q3K540_MONAL